MQRLPILKHLKLLPIASLTFAAGCQYNKMNESVVLFHVNQERKIDSICSDYNEKWKTELDLYFRDIQNTVDGRVQCLYSNSEVVLLLTELSREEDFLKDVGKLPENGHIFEISLSPSVEGASISAKRIEFYFDMMEKDIGPYLVRL